MSIYRIFMAISLKDVMIWIKEKNSEKKAKTSKKPLILWVEMLF